MRAAGALAAAAQRACVHNHAPPAPPPAGLRLDDAWQQASMLVVPDHQSPLWKALWDALYQGKQAATVRIPLPPAPPPAGGEARQDGGGGHALHLALVGPPLRICLWTVPPVHSPLPGMPLPLACAVLPALEGRRLRGPLPEYSASSEQALAPPALQHLQVPNVLSWRDMALFGLLYEPKEGQASIPSVHKTSRPARSILRARSGAEAATSNGGTAAAAAGDSGGDGSAGEVAAAVAAAAPAAEAAGAAGKPPLGWADDGAGNKPALELPGGSHYAAAGRPRPARAPAPRSGSPPAAEAKPLEALTIALPGHSRRIEVRGRVEAGEWGRMEGARPARAASRPLIGAAHDAARAPSQHPPRLPCPCSN